MSLTTARGELLAALEAAGIRSYYGVGAFAAPCARIFPADPWVQLSGLAGGRRTQQWEVWAVAGRSDALATFDELEALVMQINAAVETLPHWNRPSWRRPTVTDMGGTKYFACRGILETLAEVS
jgi:hypothetical protein